MIFDRTDYGNQSNKKKMEIIYLGKVWVLKYTRLKILSTLSFPIKKEIEGSGFIKKYWVHDVKPHNVECL